LEVVTGLSFARLKRKRPAATQAGRNVARMQAITPAKFHPSNKLRYVKIVFDMFPWAAYIPIVPSGEGRHHEAS
jgi:hypothetical protein